MTATFHVGDAIEVMAKLPEKSVDLILTSPPFLALRSYLPADHPDKGLEGGSQATPGEYIDWLVDVVEACARILAPHGSMCIELGDTYAGSSLGFVEADQTDGWSDGRRFRHKQEGNDRKGTGWPLAKSLSLIPELFRLTLVYGFNPLTGRQTERWRLRNVVRWVRPNPPVGALGDKFRPATSELMVFCKSAKRYFDLDAVRVPYAQPWRIGKTEDNGRGAEYPDDVGSNWSNRPNFTREDRGGAPPLDWWNIPLLEGEEETRYGPKAPEGRRADTSDPRLEPNKQRANTSWNTLGPYSPDQQPLGAPPLDWWEIPPGGYEGAHYAVFPPELCVKPIKAMCPEKVCRQCGEPSRRIVNNRDNWERQPALAAHIKERREAAGITVQELNNEFGYVAGAAWWETATPSVARVPNPTDYAKLKLRLSLSDEFDDLVFGERRWTESEVEYSNQNGRGFEGDRAMGRGGHQGMPRAERYAPDRFSDCGHDDWRPGMVLDCFGGSGTTAAVATGHGRDCILIDLDERNYQLALERVGPFILERAS